MATGQHPVLDLDHRRRSMLEQRKESWKQTVADLEDLGRNSIQETPPGEHVYLTPRDAVATLGLDVKTRKRAEDLVRQVVDDNRTLLDLAGKARDLKMNPHQVRALLEKASQLRQNRRYFGLSKAGPAKKPGKGATPKAAAKPPGSGWSEIPRGRKGGFRRPHPGGGYEYFYPGEGGGMRDQPHEDDHADAHAEHNRSEPSPEVKAAFLTLRSKAAEHGLTIHQRPDASHDMGHIDKLGTKLDIAVRQKKKAAKSEQGDPKLAKFAALGEAMQAAAKAGDMAKVEAVQDQIEQLRQEPGGEGLGSGGQTAPAPAPAGGGEVPGAQGAAEPAGGPAAGGDAPWETDHAGRPMGNDVPTSPHEAEALKSQINDMRLALRQIRDQVDKVHKPAYDQLQKQAEQVHGSPSYQGASWLLEKVKALLSLAVGAGAGAMLGGPVGAVLGMTAGMYHNQARRAKQDRDRQQQGAVVTKGEVYLDGGRLIVPTKDVILDPLLKALVHDGQTCEQAHPGMAHGDYRRVMGHIAKSGDAVSVRARELIRSGKPHRQAMAMALGSPMEKALMAGHRHKALPDELAKGDLSSVPDAPVLIRHPKSAQPVNEFGHRDGLLPGATLRLRKGDVREGGSLYVNAEDDGAFEWDGEVYPNGSQLLKAITGKSDHRLTIRRYFALGDRESMAVRSAAEQIRKAFDGASVSIDGPVIRVVGDLRAAGVPEEWWANTAGSKMYVEPAEVSRLFRDSEVA